MKQAVILAAGEGRRLRPFTMNRPKAMLFVGGKPIIQYVIESLVKSGIHNIIFIVGYHKEQILDFIGDGKSFGIEARFIIQSKQLGTAHALAQARDIVDNEFLVLAGDKLIASETLLPLIKVSPPALLIKREESPSRYGVVNQSDGKLIAIAEKPAVPEDNLINTGIYAFNKEVFSLLDNILDIPDVINKMLQNNQPVTTVEISRTWLNVLYPWDLLDLNFTILRQTHSVQSGIIEPGVWLKGGVSVGKNTVIHSNSYIVGPVSIGAGCEIGPNVCIYPTTSIANNVVISPFSEIRNSIIETDVRIGSASMIYDSVIDKGCVVDAKFDATSSKTEVKIEDENHKVKIGVMLGTGCRLGSAVTASPGTIIGNYSQVRSRALVTGRLPDRSIVF